VRGQAIITVLILLGYWALLALVPVPGATPGDYSVKGNFAGHVDGQYLPGKIMKEYYEYGDNVVYSGETVTFNGVTEIPAEQYVQQATDLASVGQEAKVDPKTEEFQPLGVFAMVGEGETKATNIFQLAVNKDGIIRGEYYNALTDTTEPVYGSVDKKTQRAAWTVADRKTPVYEAGIANLTKDETTMLVHFGKGKSQQFALVRIQQPEGEQPKGDK
jgi:hypothetical protein